MSKETVATIQSYRWEIIQIIQDRILNFETSGIESPVNEKGAKATNMTTNELVKFENTAGAVLRSENENEDLFKDALPILVENNEFLNKRFSSADIPMPSPGHFYKIIELAFEKDFPRREVFENVIASINNSSFNFVYFLSGNALGVSIYIGIVDNYRKPSIDGGAVSFDVAEAMIHSLSGNFMGTKYVKLAKEEIKSDIYSVIAKSKRKSFIFGVPSVNEDKTGELNNFQGVDRLINSMQGETYQVLLVCEPADKEEINGILNRVYDYYNSLTKEAERDYSANRSESKSESTQKGESDSRSKNTGTNKGRNDGYSPSGGGNNYSDSHGTSTGTSESLTKNFSTTDGSSSQIGETINYKLVNKQLKEKIEYIDKEFLPRLKLGKAKGLYRTAIYAMSSDNATLEKLEGNIRSIFQGDKSTFAPISAAKLFNQQQNSESTNSRVSALLNHFQIFDTNSASLPEKYLLSGIESKNRFAQLSSFLTPTELSLIGGLPQSEVPGIKLNEAVDFGVNVTNPEKGFELGHIMHRGNTIDNIVKIDREVLKKHIFVTGVTGSGKTTTCQKILLEAKMPFLVIEPAKTEYRQLYEKDKSITYYTVGRNDLCPFRINPMELIRGENLSSHIDLLMATFQAVYPMEASIPFLLKEAIISCYEKLGWNLDSNDNSNSDDPWNENGLYWPNFTNLVIELKSVIDKKGFANDLKQNYIGSMVSRFNDLTLGTRGSIFNVPLSIDFEKLVNENTVIELDELKNEEDKILLMGLILTRVSDVVKKCHTKDNNFRHITLIEEAHRLLSKADAGENSKKLGIQTFTDMLAEIRRYGESLIIVDQIPGKLTPEIMKNTNTKIVHKLFADDDKTAIAHCIALDDKQKNHLSKLNAGETIIYTEGWHKPVCIKISAITNLNPMQIDENEIAKQGRKLLNEERALFFPAFKDFILEDNQIDFLLRKKNKIVKSFQNMFNTLQKDDTGESREEVKTVFREIAGSFELNDKLFGALANEYWFYVKTYYGGDKFKSKSAKYIPWIANNLKTLASIGYIETTDNDEENSFIRDLFTKKITF